jgi:hypothetical protein
MRIAATGFDLSLYRSRRSRIKHRKYYKVCRAVRIDRHFANAT